jgi:hypothetical protein
VGGGGGGGVVVGPGGGVVVGAVVGQPIAIRLMAKSNPNGIISNFLLTYLLL